MLINASENWNRLLHFILPYFFLSVCGYLHTNENIGMVIKVRSNICSPDRARSTRRSYQRKSQLARELWENMEIYKQLGQWRQEWSKCFAERALRLPAAEHQSHPNPDVKRKEGHVFKRKKRQGMQIRKKKEKEQKEKRKLMRLPLSLQFSFLYFSVSINLLHSVHLSIPIPVLGTLENRLMIRPVGVVSKNDIGAASMRRKTRLWRLDELDRVSHVKRYPRIAWKGCIREHIGGG